MAKEQQQFIPIGSIKPTTPDEKRRATELAISGLQKQFGDKNIVMNMGDRVGKPYPHLATGIAEFDLYALGIGGFADGRIIELYGPESGGKTTLAMTTVAAAQNVGDMAFYVDAEHSVDPNWAATLGVRVDDLLVSQPDYGEQAIEVAIALVESGAFRIGVVDSVSALVPRAELDGEMTDQHVGLQARLMSKAMRKLEGTCNKMGTTLIFINQIREKIGVMFGSPETTSGGRALKFAASVRVDVRRVAGGDIKDGNTQIGHDVKLKVAKNKLAPPFRDVVVPFRYDIGFDGTASLVNMATAGGVVEKAGAWYSYKGERIGQGLTKTADFLRDNGGMADLIRKDIEVKLGIGVTA